MGSFSRCLPVTLSFEGGAVDNKKDPGGRTNKGVTQATYNAYRRSKGLAQRDVFLISGAEVTEIYLRDFWTPLNGDRLAAGVDLATFDAGVNSGPGRALKWLMASIGGPDDQTVKKLCAKRLGFTKSLAIWKTFGKGWGKRVAAIEAKGVAWALAAVVPAAEVKNKLAAEQAAAEKKSTNRATGAATAGTATGAGGGDVIVNPDHADQIAGWLLGGLLAAGATIAAVLVIRAIIHRERADAYRAEAETL